MLVEAIKDSYLYMLNVIMSVSVILSRARLCQCQSQEPETWTEARTQASVPISVLTYNVNVLGILSGILQWILEHSPQRRVSVWPGLAGTGSRLG
jgi:ABC-type uncharacterized transport system permease subunit